MTYTEPTDEPYRYNRQNPPLFYIAPNEHTEKVHWEQSMRVISREYYRLSRTHEIKAEVPLTNGMTAGEFAMYTLTSSHTKRAKNIVSPDDDGESPAE